MLFRSISELNGTSGVYKQVLHVDSNGKFKQAYVSAYADIPASCRMEDYGEDYHDSDEIFIWGRHEMTTCQMGWKSPEEFIKSMNLREAGIKFKPLEKKSLL